MYLYLNMYASVAVNAMQCNAMQCEMSDIQLSLLSR